MGLTRKAAGLALLLIFGLLYATPAAGQDDPYGSTSTTRPRPRTATIELSVRSGPPGTRVEVEACGYAPGVGGGSITFSGEVVASGLTAGADGCLKTGAEDDPSFLVPEDARTGSHPVCSVVAGYNTPCARFRVPNEPGPPEDRGGGRPQSEVLGASVEREDASSGGGSSSGGSLPRTGLAVGLLGALAVALLFGGRTLLDASKRNGSSASR